MPLDSPIFIGFVDGASWHTHNLASVAWVIYFPFVQLVSSGGACLGFATNNIVEYSIVIELLSNASLLFIRHSLIHLDLQLIVSHLNGIYRIHNPSLL